LYISCWSTAPFSYIERLSINHKNCKGKQIQAHFNGIRTYCTSFYGALLLEYDSTLIERLYVAWRKCIKFLYDLPHRNHTMLINYIVQDIPIAEQLFKRFVKFVKSSTLSNNAICKLAVSLPLNGDNSVVCRNINLICENIIWINVFLIGYH